MTGPFPYEIVAQPFDSAAVPVTPPYIVNTCTGGNQCHPCVTSNGEEDYLIVWDSHKSDAAGCCVRGQFCMQDGEIIDDEMVLNTNATGRNWYPDAAMAPDGTYVVVWISEDLNGCGYGVFGAIGAKP